MNNQQRAAMQTAVEALNIAVLWIDYRLHDLTEVRAAITTLRETLALDLIEKKAIAKFKEKQL